MLEIVGQDRPGIVRQISHALASYGVTFDMEAPRPAAFHAAGAGGLWTTVGDLARWDAAFYDQASIAPRLAERGALDDEVL